jgi:hypothetical protein
MQTFEAVTYKLMKRHLSFEVTYYFGRPVVKLVATWDGQFNLLKNLLDEDGIKYKTGENTAGYLIIIEVE